MSRAARWAALGHRGATVWLTGLPAAGKSTIAGAVEQRLLASGRPAYRLDGDVLRSGLCSDLGFDADSRDENVRRTAEVARMLAESGTIALVSLISPYRAGRAQARRRHAAAGVPFLEVWVATPLSECERRDPKGLYRRARAGELPRLTGVGDPYEPPDAAELVLTADLSVGQAASRVIDLVESICAARSPSAK